SPDAIDAARDRTDCLLHIWKNHLADLAAAPGAWDQKVLTYLTESFSEKLDENVFPPLQIDGFERLYSELLIMQGDEAFTAAFASRFDLAGIRTSSFEGELFEDGGINLSGVPGAEMHNLYLS